MYKFEESIRPNTIEISFENPFALFSVDPFHEIVTVYAKKYGLKIKTIDERYQYKFADDKLDIRIYWFALFTIYVYVPVSSNIPEVKKRLGEVMRELNILHSKAPKPTYTPWNQPHGWEC